MIKSGEKVFCGKYNLYIILLKCYAMVLYIVYLVLFFPKNLCIPLSYTYRIVLRLYKLVNLIYSLQEPLIFLINAFETTLYYAITFDDIILINKMAR